MDGSVRVLSPAFYLNGRPELLTILPDELRYIVLREVIPVLARFLGYPYAPTIHLRSRDPEGDRNTVGMRVGPISEEGVQLSFQYGKRGSCWGFVLPNPPGVPKMEVRERLLVASAWYTKNHPHLFLPPDERPIKAGKEAGRLISERRF